MATGKERGFKDWKGSKNFRRSARNYIEPDSITRTSSKRKKKDTKRWCKGIEGREHIWSLYKKYDFGNWWEYRCDNCRKELWGKPKHGFIKKISYRSNDEFDIIPVSELKF